MNMIRQPHIPKSLSAFAAGLLPVVGMGLFGLVVAQAVNGGQILGEALAAETVSVGGATLAFVGMAAYLGWHTLKTYRAIKFAAAFQ